MDEKTLYQIWEEMLKKKPGWDPYTSECLDSGAICLQDCDPWCLHLDLRPCKIISFIRRNCRRERQSGSADSKSGGEDD